MDTPLVILATRNNRTATRLVPSGAQVFSASCVPPHRSATTARRHTHAMTGRPRGRGITGAHAHGTDVNVMQLIFPAVSDP